MQESVQALSKKRGQELACFSNSHRYSRTKQGKIEERKSKGTKSGAPFGVEQPPICFDGGNI